MKNPLHITAESLSERALLMSDTELAVSALLDEFIDLIRARDPALIDNLWGDGEFILIGSEQNEICRTRAQLAAKLTAVFEQPATLVFTFPDRRVRSAGAVAWLFAEGMLARHDPQGQQQTRPYLISCVFEKADGMWRWRQFLGSEPR
jgi:ketosteroid isomerase-like protein